VLPWCCPRIGWCQEGKNRAEILNQYQRVTGAPEEIRTPDPQIRSLMVAALAIGVTLDVCRYSTEAVPAATILLPN